MRSFVRCNLQKLLSLRNLTSIKYRKKFSSSKSIILGIETSCDDTGCAVVDSDGNILGEALCSQHMIHLSNGGIIPPLAQDLHRQNIEKVVSDALNSANISFKDINAIATTVKPGLPLSLIIGMKYGKHLSKTYNKPFLPIHHMEAHALTARMHDRTIDFPFLVLLISGGHCLLAIAKSVHEFYLLGQSLDDAPGEAFDKVSRRMKLRNLADYAKLSGGQAVEVAASRASDPTLFEFGVPLLQHRDCNFSMGGIKAQLKRHVIKEEAKFDVPPDGVIPNVEDLCAGFLLVVTRHLCHRVQRAMEYATLRNLIPEDKKVLVVSGGVACNNFIANGLEIVCDELGYKMVRPPPKLCTDNGVMIAWNGIERWRTGVGIAEDLDLIDVEKSCPLGVNAINDVVAADIRCKWVSLKKLLDQFQPTENQGKCVV